MTAIIQFPTAAVRSARANTLEGALEALDCSFRALQSQEFAVECLQEELEELYKQLQEAKEGVAGRLQEAREARAKAVALGADEDDLYDLGALHLK